MSYRCEQCKKSTDKRQRLLKQVIYKPSNPQDGKHGLQIAREVKLCPECMAKQSKAN